MMTDRAGLRDTDRTFKQLLAIAMPNDRGPGDGVPGG